MSSKISKDAKKLDQMTQTLRKGFAWTTTHSKIVGVAILAFVAVGLGASIMSHLSQRKEVTQQEKYFLLEKAYSDKKASFEEAERAALIAAQDKKNPPPASTPKKASGDLTQDYGSIITNLETFVESTPKTQAAQMAALNLTDAYLRYKKPDSALSALQKIEPGLDKKDVLSALVHIQWGNVLVEKGDCEGALGHWEKVISNKNFSYAHDEARLRMGFCYQSMNDLAKAEQVYAEITKSSGDSSRDFAADREAERYLRLIQVKKNL